MPCTPVSSSMSLAVLIGSLLAGVSTAAEYRAEKRAVVEAAEVIEDDLYIFGDEITIEGEVQGDVIAAGRVIRINGSVTGDLIAAAQAIVIKGRVGDDVRMAGQVLQVDDGASIADDLIVAGFSLEITDGSSIDGDLVYSGYQALLAGTVGGKVNGTMANCQVTGNIGGKVNLKVDRNEADAQTYTAGSRPPISFPNVPPGLTVSETATIDGELKYRSLHEADIASAAQITGGIEHKQIEAEQPPTLTERAQSLFGRYAALLVVGVVVLLVAPTWMQRLSENVKTRPLASLGWGVAGMLGFVVLLIVSLVAMMVLAWLAGLTKLTGLVPVVVVLGLAGGGTLLVGFWFFTTYLAEIVVGFFAGSWLLSAADPKLGENRFLSLLVGLVLLAFVSSIPYLGSIVGWLVVLLAAGALLGWMLGKKRRAAASKQIAQPAPQ